MGELDEKIINDLIKDMGVTRKQIMDHFDVLVKDGYAKKGLDNFEITQKGSKYVEKEILKK